MTNHHFPFHHLVFHLQSPHGALVSLKACHWLSAANLSLGLYLRKLFLVSCRDAHAQERALIHSLFISIVLKNFFPLPIINLSCALALCGDEGHGMVLLMCEYVCRKTAGQSMKLTLKFLSQTQSH